MAERRARRRGPDGLARAARSLLWGLLGVSGFMNLLLLFAATYVAALDDVVLPGRNGATLFGLFSVLILAYLIYGLLELLRSRSLVDFAEAVEAELAPLIHDGLSFVAVSGRGIHDGLQPMYDMDRVRTFLLGRAPAAFLDIIWAPLAILFLFVLDPWLGVAALVLSVPILACSVMVGRWAGSMADAATQSASLRRALAEEMRDNTLVIRSMGMDLRVRQRWVEVGLRSFELLRGVQRRSIGLSGVARVVRLILFGLVLTIGALLSFHDNASWGIAVTAALILFQALAPLGEATIGWSDGHAALEAWRRLRLLAGQIHSRDIITVLPPPTEELAVEDVHALAPGSTRLAVRGVGFRLQAGEVLAIVGGAGSGKTALLNAVLGIWPTLRGTIRFDGAAQDQWNADSLGENIGYLPQTATLMTGTVAQNIARFDPDATADQIIAAAANAGVHDFLLRLLDGYDTQVGRDGARLSGAQRQRVALARAMFRDPFLVVLDEPTTNFDGDGERLLTEVIARIRARRGIAIIVTHRPPILAQVDQIMHLQEGAIAAFGPTVHMLPRLLGTAPTAA